MCVCGGGGGVGSPPKQSQTIPNTFLGPSDKTHLNVWAKKRIFLQNYPKARLDICGERKARLVAE